MKTFNQYMLMSEGFDKPYRYSFSNAPTSRYEVAADFTTDAGIKYEVMFETSEYSDGAWDLAFEMVDAKKHSKNPTEGGWFTGLGITRTGDAFRVFATVIAIFKDFLEKYEPNKVYFSATEKSRKDLYAAMIKRLPRITRNYTAKAMRGNSFFRLVKKGLEEETDYDELMEGFDKPAKLNWILRGGKNPFSGGAREWIATFKIEENETEYKVTFSEDNSESDNWNFDFSLTKVGGRNINRHSQSITGTGQSFKVFASVVAALKEMLKKEKPRRIEFVAVEPSRMQLYNVMVKKIGRISSNYIANQVTYFKGYYEIVRKDSRNVKEQQQIDEGFDSPEKWSWRHKKPIRIITSKRAGEIFLDGVWRADFDIEENQSSYLVDFTDWRVVETGFKEEGVYSLDFELKGMGFSITGRGQAFKVFATVIDILKAFLGENKPKEIRFTAHEKSRKELYDAMIKKVGRITTEYVGKKEGKYYKIIRKGT
jgi:hypothetical protein